MSGFDDIRPIPGSCADGRILIAGPCSAESAGQVMEAAQAIAATPARILRAGVWKPRTHPGGFEGVGLPALAWLAEAKARTGLLTATEVATRAHVDAALDAGIDILWIGARTTANPFAVQEISDALAARGGTDVTVLVKNPVSPDIELWIGALQRVYAAGCRRLGAIHRGFTTYGDSPYRNPPYWSIPIELRRRVPGLPVICDPSHICGRADMVGPTAVRAMEMGFDGLIIESHPAPAEALSDAAQQLTLPALASLLDSLPARAAGSADHELDELRRQIDAADHELLETVARRMAIARCIGEIKRRSGLSVVQPQRYSRLIESRKAMGQELGLEPHMLQTILEALHAESVRQQLNESDERK